MKRLFVSGAFLGAFLLLIPSVNAQSNQLLQGTVLKLQLLNGLNTSVARDGDPFTAVVVEPVMLGNQLLLPAGTRVHGQVGHIVRPKHFAVFRGEASMNLFFRTIEVDSRLIPAPMSIVSIYSGDPQGDRVRKDLRTVEGEVVEEKRDIKNDVIEGSMGTAGGTLLGAVFSNVTRGFAFGLIGSSAYIVEKRGKDIDLPAQTGILVRLDSTISIPAAVSHGEAYHSGMN